MGSPRMLHGHLHQADQLHASSISCMLNRRGFHKMLPYSQGKVTTVQVDIQQPYVHCTKKSTRVPVSPVPSAQLATCCVAVTDPHGAADLPIFRAQLATCCVAVTDPDGAADLPIFRAAITDKNDHTAFNAIFEYIVDSTAVLV